MKEIKLLKIFRIFNETQIKDFKLFLSSPYLNKGRNLKSVYDKLIKNYPDISKMTEDYKKLIEKAKSPQVVKNYMSHLTELALDFLGYENMRNNETLLNIETGKTLLRFNSLELMTERINESKETELNKKTSILDYYYLFKITGLEGSYYYEKHNQKMLFDTQVETTSYLIAYFILELNKRIETISSLNYNNNYDSPILGEVDKLINCESLDRIIEQTNIKNKKFLKFFRQCFKPVSIALKDKPDLKQFIYLVENYNKIFDTLHPFLNYTISNNLWNQWVIIQNTMGVEAYDTGFKLIDKYLLKIYDQKEYENFRMHILHFVNYIDIALMCEKYDWVKKFIEKYKYQLLEKQQKDVVVYSYGLLCFAQRKYKESLTHFNNVEHTVENLKYELRMKMLQLNYELKYFENLPEMIETYRKFLKESEEQYSYNIESYKLFLNYFKKLVKLRLNNDVSETELTRNKLTKNSNTSERRWLTEKYDGLLSGKT